MDVRKELFRVRNESKRVLVVGLGISGFSVAALLSRAGYKVVAIDKASEQKYRLPAGAETLADLKMRGVEVHLGVDGEDVGKYLGEVGLCVLSPGVSLESAVSGALKRLNAPCIGELEFALEILGARSVLVTGSNGKSTTVSLIHDMLTRAGFQSRLCGNIGIPVSALVEIAALTAPRQVPEREILVVEASSYQLESCSVLKPTVGVWLNLSDNHLERHGTMERYLAAKAKLFERQDQSCLAVLNGDDAWYTAMLRHVAAPIQQFGAKISKGARIQYKPGVHDKVELSTLSPVESYDCSKARLIGYHNRYNIAAALLACRWLGADREILQGSIDNFIPLEHRIEMIGERSGVSYINDSKSTTVAASVAALQAVSESFPERQVVLMLGGLAKAGSWQPLMTQLQQRRSSRPVICFGGDGRLIHSHCRNAGIESVVAKDLEEGVFAARRVASPGDIVLLSPGCASFDQFSGFEERGTAFKRLVSEERSLRPMEGTL